MGYPAHLKHQEETKSGTVPTWIELESIILKALNKIVPNTEIIDPKNQYMFKADTIGYIDDNNIVRYYPQEYSTYEIQTHTQETFQTWCTLLEITGGQLNIDNVPFTHGKTF